MGVECVRADVFQAQPEGQKIRRTRLGIRERNAFAVTPYGGDIQPSCPRHSGKGQPMFNACVVDDVHTGTLHRRKNLVNAKAHVDVTRGLIGFRPMKSRIATDKAWKAIMERVNQLRDTGATYAELGKMLGTSAATVNRWVNEDAGGESTPFSNMLHYMEVLGLAWDEVLVGFSPSDCGYGYVR